MKQASLILTFLAFSFSLHGQWHKVISNTSENLYDIFFVDSLEGYCVGGTDYSGSINSNGVILKTTDGGETWNNIFIKDSMSIRSIVIVEENGNLKLHAFALKNDSSYLISTELNTQQQNWLIQSIAYRPTEVTVFNNEVYFIDELDNALKKLRHNQITSLDSPVTYFDVSKDGIVCLDIVGFEIRNTQDFGISWDTLPTFPATYSTSNLAYGGIKKIDNYIILNGTYPGMIVYSTDNGLLWETNYNAPEYASYIVSENLIFGVTNSTIDYSMDLGVIWSINDSLQGQSSGTKMKFYYGTGFVIGVNGLIYKSVNISLSTLENNLKKKINIFPNPVGESLKIETLDSMVFSIINLIDDKGNLVKEYNPKERTLTVENLPSGVYFLQLETSEGYLVKKVFIE